MVVSNCFKGFGELEFDSQQAITNGFLKNVVEKQGWEKNVNVKKFGDGIDSKAVLDYESKNFYTVDSEKQKEVNKANQPVISRF